MKTIRILFVALAFAFGGAGAAEAGTEDEVRGMFEKFVAAQNAHDTAAVQELLHDSPQFLWITRGMQVWGRTAAVQRFATLHQGTWKLEPDWAALRIVAVGSETAHLVVPVTFTTGAAGQPPVQTRMFLNQVLLRTAAGWRVTTIVPVPAAAP
jgi:hypothetical protein